jgi:hypothetical protein
MIRKDMTHENTYRDDTTAVVEADSTDYARPIWLADNAMQDKCHAQLSLWLVLHRTRINTEEYIFFLF